MDDGREYSESKERSHGISVKSQLLKSCIEGFSNNFPREIINMSKRLDLELKLFKNKSKLHLLLFFSGHGLTIDQIAKESLEQWKRWYIKNEEQAQQNAQLALRRGDLEDFGRHAADILEQQAHYRFYQSAINKFDMIPELESALKNIKNAKGLQR